ncbi:MAG: molybdopterin-guanine dinucleotide biosynthesis protein A [Sulfurimonas sp.]|jgi:molybdopterin-guanine dinucleotide biosynthesis protein A|uniref:molybdenum cofactor guanylyltransferase MobA n=1 Tax=Sulfurimonas sp. TaxID=2022749 RepID=UPI0039E3DA8A
MLTIPCILFAGGKSSRMGEDKALLPFGEFSTLTEFQLNKLQKIFKNVYISCKNKNKFNFTANFIEDIPTDNVYAPTTGFIASFEKLQCEKFFAMSVDTPFINETQINDLVRMDNNNLDATIATLKDKMQPMCGIYHKSLHKHFIKMLETNTHKLGFLLKNSNTQYINFDNEKSFLNLNNPSQYKEALTLI